MLQEILELIGQAVPAASFADWVQAIGVYAMTVNKNIGHEQYKQTLADRLLIQGREEGREEGQFIALLTSDILPTTKTE